MSKVDLFIFPQNGNALESLGCLNESYNFKGWIDDSTEKVDKTFYGAKVYSRGILKEFSNSKVLAVPGNPTNFRSRKKLIDSLKIEDSRFATIISSNAWISPLAKIGKNVLIMHGAVVTSNAVIEDHVCILPNTVIHHDVIVGAYSLIGASVVVAGGAIIEQNTYIGSGSKIKNGIRIGEGALVGMGSNVVSDVPAGVTARGNPARCF